MPSPAAEPRRFAHPTEGLAAELRLLKAVADGRAEGSALLWETTRSLVVPRGVARRPGFEAAARASAGCGWPVAVRETGGAPVPQGPGVLNLALAFAAPPGRPPSIAQTYAALCDPISAALRGLGLDSRVGPVEGSFCDGAHNLTLGGRKVVGTAQRWRRRGGFGHALLAHALILVDGDNGPRVEAVRRLCRDLGVVVELRVDAHTTLAAELRGASVQLAELPAVLLGIVTGHHARSTEEQAPTARRRGGAHGMPRAEEGARHDRVEA